jgi:hypothetical protein
VPPLLRDKRQLRGYPPNLHQPRVLLAADAEAREEEYMARDLLPAV